MGSVEDRVFSTLSFMTTKFRNKFGFDHWDLINAHVLLKPFDNGNKWRTCTPCLPTVYFGKHSSHEPSRIESNSNHKKSRYCEHSCGVSTCRRETKEGHRYCDEHLTQIIVDPWDEEEDIEERRESYISRWEDWRGYKLRVRCSLLLEGRCLVVE